MPTARLISWNVNGLRACATKGFRTAIDSLDADFVCLQETRLKPPQIESLEMPDYPFQHLHPADKAGYSGTMILSRSRPITVETDFGRTAFRGEGRVIAAEFPTFFLVNAYVPNSQNELRRLDYRVNTWEPALRDYLSRLNLEKPVLYCGDLNVSHQEIDLARPSANRRNAGFTDEERNAFTELLNCGFIDTYRHQNPETTGAYSWWSFRGGARARNIGWRLDYVVASSSLTDHIQTTAIHPEVTGSDHCPVSLTFTPPEGQASRTNSGPSRRCGI